MSNLTFSIKKNRELSQFEARVGSFRRRFSDPLGRKKHVARAFSSSLREHPAQMGKRNRRREASSDWEANISDESANASGNRSITEHPAAGAVGESGDGIDNGQTDNQNGDGRSRQSKGGIPSQRKHKSTLGPWTHAVGEVVQEMSATQRAINNLQGMFTTHMDDLGIVDDSKRRINQLEEQCREKDAVIQEQKATISTLRAMDQEAMAAIESDRAQIERSKKELEQDKAKLATRISVATAEEKHKMKREFEERIARQDKNHETRMKELDAEFARKREENSTRATALEAENGRLSVKAKQQEATLKAQEDELLQLKDQYDVLTRAKDSFRSEKEGLEKELDKIKNEFALDNKTAAHFEKQFADICGEIERISGKYFHDKEDEDLEEVHKRLAAEDSCFRSVPIDDSEDSSSLCAAHAQRIISNAICDNVWKPLRSELTFQQPEFGTLLGKMSEVFDKADQHRRTANVWTALTMRALQALDAEAAISPVLESTQNPHFTGCNRADSVVSDVLRVLGPLVCASRTESLRVDLLIVVNSSIDIWNNAQAGGLRITIHPSLDRAQREEWRSQQFDPVSPLPDGPDLDLVSKTHLRVFTLFPRIVARTQDNVVPGSWPELEPIVVHPGIGLPEWSSLVVRGKHAQEEREEKLNKAIKKMKRESYRTRRVRGHGRNESTGSSTSGPPSPSTRWKMEGAMKVVET